METPERENGYLVYPDRDYTGYGANRTISMFKGFIVEYFGNQQTKKCAKSWALIPVMNLFDENVQAFIYAIGLLYAFLGIAVISDVFMARVSRKKSSSRTAKRSRWPFGILLLQT